MARSYKKHFMDKTVFQKEACAMSKDKDKPKGKQSNKSRQESSSFLNDAAFRDNGRYRAMLDPVAHYVFARKGCEANLLAFVNSVFDDSRRPQVKSLKILNPYDGKTSASDKPVIVDIVAEDELERKINIEFQVLPHDCFLERCVYYWSRLYSRLLSEGYEYNTLTPVVSIILTDFPIWRHLGDVSGLVADKIHLSSSMRMNEDTRVSLTDHFEMHFVQLPKEINAATLAEVRPKLADWLTYFGYPNKTTEADMQTVAVKNPEVESALETYERFHQSPELLAVAEGSERYRRDVAAYVATRERVGREEGREEGEAKGKRDALIHVLTKRSAHCRTTLRRPLRD